MGNVTINFSKICKKNITFKLKCLNLVPDRSKENKDLASFSRNRIYDWF